MSNWFKTVVLAALRRGGKNDLTERMRGVESRLKAAPLTPPVPEDLHDAIMRAVRRSATAAVRPPARVPRWQLGFGAAACVGLGLWLLLPPAEKPHTLSLSTTPLERTQLLAQEAPAKAFSPLSQELAALKRDLDGAVEFVMASVP